ncbi:helix-turn-helix domain-containing protein [Streptomyces sp. UH6]|uniref:helix-turn-helix domain-containing protein n=1 Tax=Streptomyces sp. UH6 TaxID=2748379 RepID=UPI0035BC4A7A
MLADAATCCYVSLVTPNGTAIRALRNALKLSIRSVARDAHCDPSHLSRLERGEAGMGEPGLRRIAAVLGVSVAAINREEEP